MVKNLMQNPEQGQEQEPVVVDPRMVRVPADDSSDEERRAFYRAIGVPESPDAYQIDVKSHLIASDPQVNQYLYDLGFTNKQVQAVYDLAAEKVLPVIEDLAADYEADRQRGSLIQHFGGAEKFNEVARQVSLWAKQNVPPSVVDALSTTYEGVMTLYKMMANNEPAMIAAQGGVNDLLDEDGLRKVMMDPKYWKEQDPATLKKVSDGFKRLYAKK